ncbi:MAG TPA: HupE/UreJ family protein [Steroidobacteraceae bacterium]|nr:HupE/UreJ family protein [Steroidobacteraceae bacterium]
MTRTHRYLVRTASLCVSLLPALALAHPGHGAEDSFLAGVLHPANGIDHVAGFFLVGLLASRLDSRIFRPMIAALLGVLVAAGTMDSDGWRYAAGFMLTGAGLAAAGVAATRAATRFMSASTTAAARRSRI